MQDSTDVSNVEDVGISFKERLEEYLMDLLGTLKEGGQAVMDEIPLFVEEYLYWGATEASIYAFVFLFLSSALIYFAIRMFKAGRDYEFESIHDDTKGAYYFLGILSSALSILTLSKFLEETLIALKIMIAPRVYLIENLMQLIN